MKKTRNTMQKQLVRELLIDNYTHPTAEDVFVLARNKNSIISKATIYRNLNLLADNGEISRIITPIGPDHFDYNTDNHYHFLCQNCYKLLDTEIPYDNNLNEIIPKGCKTIWHKLILIGLCFDCNE